MFKLFKKPSPMAKYTPAQKAANIALLEMKLARIKRELFASYSERGAGYAISTPQAFELLALARKGFVNLAKGLNIGDNVTAYVTNDQLIIKGF